MLKQGKAWRGPRRRCDRSNRIWPRKLLRPLTAAVATQLHTSNNYEEHIARAEAIKATLEMLEVAITSNHLSQHEVTSQYLKIIENTSFIEAAR